MISHQHKCIFIHIPKCAGTSIETALGHLEQHTGRGGQDHRSLRMIERPFPTPHVLSSPDNVAEALRRLRAKVRRQRNDRNRLTVTRSEYVSYFKFTIVRNPWSRAFSAYQNVLRDSIHQEKHGIRGSISLKEYLRRFAGQRLIKPQTYFIRDFSGAIPLDFIGRFENLRADFEKACHMMGLTRVAELPHEIKGNANNYREHFDSESVDMVHRAYRDEIRLFEYSF